MRVPVWTRTVVKVVVSAGLLTFLLRKISLDELVELVAGMDVRLIVAAMAVFFVSNVLGALQWYRLMRSSRVVVSFGQAFRFYFVGLFFNNFLPANIGGDAVKVYDVTRLGGSVYQVVAVTLLDRVFGIFTLCLLALVALIAADRIQHVETGALYALIFIGCMTPILGFYFIEPLGKLLRRLIAMVRPLAVDRRGAEILDHMSEFKGRRGFVMSLIGLSGVIQALRVSTHVLVALSLGVAVDRDVALLFFVFVPLLSLAMIPPITINGLGVREGLGIVLFAQAGIGRTDAFAIEFVTYLVSVTISLVGFGFFVARGHGPQTANAARSEASNPDSTRT